MNKNSRFVFSIFGLFMVGAAVFLSLTLISPPAPLPVEAPANEFSAGRAMRDLEVIAREPHPMGEFQAHTAVRDYLLDEIRSLGLEPQVQETFGVRVVHPAFIIGGYVDNVLVKLPGSDPDGALLLIAHYDTTPGAPGAGDNGSGVVTLLEILRNLHAGSPLRQDVILFFTDGHEPGIIGTHAFAAQNPWFEGVKMVINMDILRKGPPVLAQISQGNGLWIQALARTARRPAYISLPSHLFASGDSDLIPFQKAGLPGISFGTAAVAQENHTMMDRFESVGADSVQYAGNHILALVRYLGENPNLDLDVAGRGYPPEQTFFPLLGRMVHYPASWAWLPAVLAGLSFLGVIAYGLFRRLLTWMGIGLGFLTLLPCLGLSLGINYLLWEGLQALHPEYQYSPYRPHLSDDALYALGFFIIALAVFVFSTGLMRKKISAMDLAAGSLLVWLLVTVVTTILLPASSYLAAWTQLPGSLALLLSMSVQSKKQGEIISGLGFLASAVLVTFLWIPVLKTAFLFLGLIMNWLLIGVAALWFGGMLPAIDWLTNPRRLTFAWTMLLVGLGFLLAGNFLVGKNSPPPLVNPIGYWLNAESGEAHWLAFIGGQRTDARTTARIQVAFPPELDSRQKRLLVDPVRKPYAEIFPAAPPFSVLTNTAPNLPLDGPHLEVIADAWVKGHRVTKIKLVSSMRDRLYLILPGDNPLLALTVPKNERIELSPEADPAKMLRIDGIQEESIEITLEFSNPDATQILVVEEKTGLPEFPGLSTRPEPGTMPSPGEFAQGVPADFTAVSRVYEIEEIDSK
ncbi:MAG: M28 family peptidase [Chloroflexota bacterium]|nr:MAG: M28 family peptidase [Chloroflexota bacterium]